MILANPNGLAKSFPLFCDAVAQWRQPTPPLMELFQRVSLEFFCLDAALIYFPAFISPAILRSAGPARL